MKKRTSLGAVESSDVCDATLEQWPRGRSRLNYSTIWRKK